MLAKLTSVVAVAAVLLLSVAFQAQADNWQPFCRDGINANSRCVWQSRQWLYGVGIKNSPLGVPGHYLCVGAKTSIDGSGGNALPFRCESLALYQEIWTPGGNSNWGYATLINNNPEYALATGLAFHRT